MTLIPLENDQLNISKRFRKTDYFALIQDKKISIEKNLYKVSKSNEFFEYFKTLNIQKLYLKNLGYKTFLRLDKLGIKVYLIENTTLSQTINENTLIPINQENANKLCTLGHNKQ